MNSYAMIKDDAVINVISIRRSQASEFPNCVELGDIPVMIGDTYLEGRFYRDGAEIKSITKQLSEAVSDTKVVFTILKGEE